MSNPPALTPAQVESIEREAKTSGVLPAYRKLIRGGQSPRMALMLASQKFPGVNGTDAKFNRLEGERVKEIGDEEMGKIVSIARRAGINTTGKTYNGALGKYADPLAWVSGTSDVRTAAKEKGLSIRGQVNMENQPKERKPVRLAKHLIRDTEKLYMEANPALKERVKKSPKVRRELREMIIEKHSTKKVKK